MFSWVFALFWGGGCGLGLRVKGFRFRALGLTIRIYGFNRVH